ncbi:MAG: hypothetical protein U0163_06485 [Gemmatimonadaceae bacterium]
MTNVIAALQGPGARRSRNAPAPAVKLNQDERFRQVGLAGRGRDHLPIRAPGQPEQHDDSLERHRHSCRSGYRRARDFGCSEVVVAEAIGTYETDGHRTARRRRGDAVYGSLGRIDVKKDKE